MTDPNSQIYSYYNSLQPDQRQKVGTAYHGLPQTQQQSFLQQPYSQQQTQVNQWAGMTTAPPPAAPPPAAPPSTPAPTAPPPASGTIYASGAPTGGTDPFVSMGGGVRLPNGDWVPKSHPSAAQYVTGTTPPPPGTPPPATNQTVAQEFREQLMKLLQRDPTQIDPNDPATLAQTNAYDRGLERARAERREAAAARLASQGILDSGALDAEVASGYQDKGEASAANRAAVTLQELQTRRAEFQNALQMGAGILSQEDESALRRELAKLDAEVRRQGFAVQKSLGMADIDLRRFLGTGQLSLGLLGTLLGNQQFNDRLGFDIGSFDASLRNNSLLRLLGGG